VPARLAGRIATAGRAERLAYRRDGLSVRGVQGFGGSGAVGRLDRSPPPAVALRAARSREPGRADSTLRLSDEAAVLGRRSELRHVRLGGPWRSRPNISVRKSGRSEP